jgi:hypothetical protein
VPNAVLVIGTLAWTERWTWNAGLCSFRDLDQVAELYGSKINPDVQFLEVGVDSATAEVGPRSGIIEVEGDLSHCFLQAPFWCGALRSWLAIV